MAEVPCQPSNSYAGFFNGEDSQPSLMRASRALNMLYYTWSCKQVWLTCNTHHRSGMVSVCAILLGSPCRKLGRQLTVCSDAERLAIFGMYVVVLSSSPGASIIDIQ